MYAATATDDRTTPTSHPSRPATVAVVLGQTPTVFSDALAPYEVFARSPRFAVAAVAVGSGPAPVQGGPQIVPHHTLADIAHGAAPQPDVVVVPAVADPHGPGEAALRAWLAEQAERGTRILGVCAGSRVLAAAGVLEGRAATSHWSRLRALRRRHPGVEWVEGQRYVQDGTVTTTAGITSGVPGALRLVADVAGADEAQRVGAAVGYPGWSLTGSTAIPVASFGVRDLPLAGHALLGRRRPTFGIGLADGVGEIDAASAFEAYHVSYAARTVAVAERADVSTRHGLQLRTVPLAEAPRLDRLLVPGAGRDADVPVSLRDWAATARLRAEPLVGPSGVGGFDGALEHLAQHAGRATARSVAKMIDYPADHLDLVPRRPEGPRRGSRRTG